VRRIYPDRHTVIITECGMTQGVHPQGVGDVGPWHASHPISEDDYWTSLMWYNEKLMQDDYVMGACLFVVGAVSPWESFEHLGGIVDRLERMPVSEPGLAEAVGGVEVAEPAVVEPEIVASTVAEPEVAPAEVVSPAVESDDVLSSYVLFPAGAHWDWYAACRFYFERFRPTWGENPRDAARADVIVCINPSQETLEALRLLNPSAHLEVIQASDPAELSARVGQRILSGKA
jgi:hypothetical protein